MLDKRAVISKAINNMFTEITDNLDIPSGNTDFILEEDIAEIETKIEESIDYYLTYCCAI